MSKYKKYLKIIQEAKFYSYDDENLSDEEEQEIDLTEEERWQSYVDNKDIYNLKKMIRDGFDPTYDEGYAIKRLFDFEENDAVRFLILSDKRLVNYMDSGRLFWWAADKGYGDIIKVLLKYSDFDPVKNKAIQKASYHGYTEAIKALLRDSRVDPSIDGNKSIIDASDRGHNEIVKELLNDPRIDPSDNKNWTIRWAAKRGNYNLVDLLLSDKRVDPSEENNDALRSAFNNGHNRVVSRLLRDDRVRKNLDDEDWFTWKLQEKGFI